MSDQDNEAADKPLFQIGDVVVLKSGGPDMTISQVLNKGSTYSNPDHTLYCVNWFDEKGNSVTDEFLEPMLNWSHEPESKVFKA